MKIGEKNVGMTDRLIRIVLGIVLIIVFLIKFVHSPWSYLVALIGLIALVTGAVGTCPFYSIFGMSTAGKKA
jgi:xanthosine utilization system XapX-like protein